jgi:hypothetical protein
MNKKLLSCFAMLSFVPTVYAVNTGAIYDVDLVKNPSVAIDGQLNEAAWHNASEINGMFHFPWEKQKAPDTKFKAFHDGNTLYFSFEVVDKEVLVDEEWKDESTVDNEDRVEIFFGGGKIDQPDNYNMQPYYAVEVDARGRVHDYSVVYYRHFDSNWKMPGLKTAAVQTSNGYVVEGSIPLKSLRDAKLIQDGRMNVGLFRAEFSKKGDETQMQWISWVSPATDYPDFHVESAFGTFRLIE